MSKEKRYTFGIQLTEAQKQAAQDTWDECVGITSGEGMIATVNLKTGTVTCTIIPCTEKEILAPHLNAMNQRTELDDLGIVG
jgi:hypothetical protein